MKILQINSVCGIRSTGRICTDIADILHSQGHICHIGYGRESVPERYRDIAVRIGSDREVRTHGLSSRCLDAHGFGSRGATRRFLAWARKYDPDLIHLHNIHGYYIHIEELFDYLKAAGKPVVWTLHDCWAFTGHCAHFDAAGCEKWRTGCGSCPQKERYPKAFLDRSRKNWERKRQCFCGVQNMRLVTPSRWLAELVKQSFLGEYPVDVIHNGIDLTVFRPTPSDFRAAHDMEDKRIVLGVASVWDDRKGLEDFFKLASMLDDSYRIVLVGLSEQQLKRLPANVLGIAQTNNVQELAEIYTAADVFVNPTYEDNYPTVNLEAQACGTPVITYRTGGSPESVEGYGTVVEKGDIAGLYQAIVSQNAGTVPNFKIFDKVDRYLEYIALYAETKLCE